MFRDVCDTYGCNGLNPSWEKRENEAKAILEGILVENFPRFMKYIKRQIQKVL